MVGSRWLPVSDANGIDVDSATRDGGHAAEVRQRRRTRRAVPAEGSDVGGRRVRADSAAMLGMKPRRETPFARCARSGQTVPTSQRWKRAARAGSMPALLAASHVAPRGHRPPRVVDDQALDCQDRPVRPPEAAGLISA